MVFAVGSVQQQALRWYAASGGVLVSNALHVQPSAYNHVMPAQQRIQVVGQGIGHGCGAGA
jgi:hypothetical protein